MVTRSLCPDELIELAAVVRAHGLRGELLLKPFNPESQLWRDLERVVLRAPDGALSEHEVSRGHVHGANVILGLADVRDRDKAESLRGSLVCIARADLPAPAEGEHYFVDLIGLTALNEEGRSVGRVADVIEYPSVSCLVVQGDEGDIEVPNTDRYVVAIDQAAKTVTLTHLDELDVLRVKGRS